MGRTRPSPEGDRAFPTPNTTSGGGGGGGAPTPTVFNSTAGAGVVGSQSYTESSGVVSLAGGIFDGWSVQNWSQVDSIVESDSGYVTITAGAGVSSSEAGTPAAVQDAIALYKDIQGDFSISFKFYSPSVTDPFLRVGLGAWVVDSGTTNAAHGVGMSFGRWNTTAGRFSSWVGLGTGTSRTLGTNYSWSDSQVKRMMVKRSGDVVTFEYAIDDVINWVDYRPLTLSTGKLDTAGSICRLGVFAGLHANGQSVRITEIAGSYIDA